MYLTNRSGRPVIVKSLHLVPLKEALHVLADAYGGVGALSVLEAVDLVRQACDEIAPRKCPNDCGLCSCAACDRRP